jgi:hypothetical protein
MEGEVGWALSRLRSLRINPSGAESNPPSQASDKMSKYRSSPLTCSGKCSPPTVWRREAFPRTEINTARVQIVSVDALDMPTPNLVALCADCVDDC